MEHIHNLFYSLDVKKKKIFDDSKWYYVNAPIYNQANSFWNVGYLNYIGKERITFKDEFLFKFVFDEKYKQYWIINKKLGENFVLSNSGMFKEKGTGFDQLWNIGQDHVSRESTLYFRIYPSMYDSANGNVIEHRYKTLFYYLFGQHHTILNDKVINVPLRFYDADLTYNIDEPLSTLQRPKKPILGLFYEEESSCPKNNFYL